MDEAPGMQQCSANPGLYTTSVMALSVGHILRRAHHGCDSDVTPGSTNASSGQFDPWHVLAHPGPEVGAYMCRSGV
eukprot:2077266-Amphidinium_carterae.1